MDWSRETKGDRTMNLLDVLYKFMGWVRVGLFMYRVKVQLPPPPTENAGLGLPIHVCRVIMTISFLGLGFRGFCGC